MNNPVLEKYYVCPICHSNDPYLYMRCNRPDCTDGRDQRIIDSDGLDYNYTRLVWRDNGKTPTENQV